MKLNFSEKSVFRKARMCESPLIGIAVARGMEESGVDRNIGEL